ncbi:MAG: LD-carboxypeptidase, partial [Oscillospiraceae bacterium]
MFMLIKPKMLRENDTVCTLSLSWGGAGDEDILWRYEVGKKRLKEQFKLNVIE